MRISFSKANSLIKETCEFHGIDIVNAWEKARRGGFLLKDGKTLYIRDIGEEKVFVLTDRSKK